MKTTLALMAQYESAVVPLKDIAQEYFGLTPHEAQRQASLNLLPVPTFRLRQSQKSPLLVHLEDLGQYIDKVRAKAKTDWERSQI